MKKKLFFVCILTVMVIAFWLMVEQVEKKQTEVILPEELSFAAIEEEYKSNKESFADILDKEDFGTFVEWNITDGMEKTAFASEGYCYAGKEILSEVLDIFGNYEYYQVPMGDKMAESAEFLCTMKLCGENNMRLRVSFYQIQKNQDFMIVRFSAEEIGGGVTEQMIVTWEPMKMYVDAGIMEQLIACLEKNTGNMSLKHAEEQITAVKKPLPSTDFLCMYHEFADQYSDFETGDAYNIYTQKLSDYDGYLKMYEVWLEWAGKGDIGRRDRFIFKIELYDNDNQLQRELYSDMENYNKVIAGG